MSRFDYEASKKLAIDDVPFAALIMAAMRKGSDTNMDLLTHAFPEIWDELRSRYNAPGGVIRGDYGDPT